MTDLSGVTITTGILPAAVRESLAQAVERIGAKIVEGVRIDTTHFVTTEGRGTAWEKARETNIPVVRPEWVDACEKNGRILGVTKFYLDVMRPGPPSEPTTNATPTPTPTPPVQKASQLPLPPTPSDKEHADSKDEESDDEEGNDTVVAKKNEEEEEAATGDDDVGAHKTEQKARRPSHGEEQKMRLEDKDGQKLAVRPGGSASKDENEDEDDDAEDGDGDEVRPASNKPASSTPDGDSFQEVQL